jgi:hypothetical protein
MVIEHRIDRRVPLHQHEARQGRVEKHHLPVRRGGQKPATDHVGIKLRALRHRDQGPRSDAAGTERRRPVAQGDHGRDRRQPASSRHRLRRSLSDPPLGLWYADRETLEALHDTVKAGKTRYIGASSRGCRSQSMVPSQALGWLVELVAWLMTQMRVARSVIAESRHCLPMTYGGNMHQYTQS